MVKIPGGAKKRPELCETITARILYGEKYPSFCAFVDQYVLLLTYKFQ